MIDGKPISVRKLLRKSQPLVEVAPTMPALPPVAPLPEASPAPQHQASDESEPTALEHWGHGENALRKSNWEVSQLLEEIWRG